MNFSHKNLKKQTFDAYLEPSNELSDKHLTSFEFIALVTYIYITKLSFIKEIKVNPMKTPFKNKYETLNTLFDTYV